MLGVHGPQGKGLKGSSAFRENAERILNPQTIYPVLPRFLAFLPVSSEVVSSTGRWHPCCQIAPFLPSPDRCQTSGLPSIPLLSPPPSTPSSGICLSLDQAAELPWLLRRALAGGQRGLSGERAQRAGLSSPLPSSCSPFSLGSEQGLSPFLLELLPHPFVSCSPPLTPFARCVRRTSPGAPLCSPRRGVMGC